MIEFALVSTVMMTFILVVMQLCIALYTYGMICESAREATRWAATRGATCQTPLSTSCTANATSVSNYAKGLGFPNIGGGTVTVNTTPNVMFPDTYNGTANCQTPSVCRVVVSVTYTMPITMPLVPKNAIALSTISKMYYIQ